MDRAKFNQIWKDISHVRPDTFQKVDLIVKNPAPPTVPLQDVLKKMANLLNNCLGLKVLPPEDKANFISIEAVGQA